MTQIQWDDEPKKAKIQWDEDPHEEAAKNIAGLLKQHSQSAMSKFEAGARAYGQGATFGFSDRALGLLKALSTEPEPESGQVSSLQDRYDKYLAEERAKNSQAEAQDPEAYHTREFVGGVLSPIGIVGKTAKAGKGLVALGKAALKTGAFGALTGGINALGHSKADLTTKEGLSQAGEDVASGAETGAALGGVMPVLGKLGETAADKLVSLGKIRLFKAAVGPFREPIKKLKAAHLYEKAKNWLQSEIGVKPWDSAGRIEDKLTERQTKLGTALSGTVSDLDKASGGSIKLDPNSIADRVENELAAPYKGSPSMGSKYDELKAHADRIRTMENPLSLKQAMSERRLAQENKDFDVANIWNEEADKKVEPLLDQAGKSGDAYRELRHEFRLNKELLTHTSSNVSAQQAHSLFGAARDTGLGGLIGYAAHGPETALKVAATVAAGHIAKVYGNQTIGNAAILVGKGAKSASKALPWLTKPTILSSTNPDDEEAMQK